jgi:hypothetical protein
LTIAPTQQKINATPTSPTAHTHINPHNNITKHITSHSTIYVNSKTITHRRVSDTMNDDRPQSSAAARGRRTNQRYRRGAHNVVLDSTARLALTQHFAAKSRTQTPAASDPVSLTISSYFSAPLGGIRVLA